METDTEITFELWLDGKKPEKILTTTSEDDLFSAIDKRQAIARCKLIVVSMIGEGIGKRSLNISHIEVGPPPTCQCGTELTADGIEIFVADKRFCSEPCARRFIDLSKVEVA